MQKRASRFELEEKIMGCWNITSELDALVTALCEKDLKQDQVVNILLGLKELYDLKFDDCFLTFEQCIKEKSV